MNVVDSSGWLEYFSNGPNSSCFSPAIEDTDSLLVPSIALYETYKRLRSQRGAEIARAAASTMMMARIINLDSPLALASAEISLTYKLSLADSIIYTIARQFRATFWTQDSDFRDLEGVNYIEAAS